MDRPKSGLTAHLETADPALWRILDDLFAVAMSPGALDAQTKILIAMALDAQAGAINGVKALSGMARGLGVTDEQIAEALRIVHLVAVNCVVAHTAVAYPTAKPE